MPDTGAPHAIFVPDENSPMVLNALLAGLAESVHNALERLVRTSGMIRVASQAERNAAFPAPVQGDQVYRTDLGRPEFFRELYHSTTNPGGAFTAGWYEAPDDTGWGLSAITPSTGWDGLRDPAGNVGGVLLGGVRRQFGRVSLAFRVDRNGADIVSGATGNIADTNVATLATRFRPQSNVYGVGIVPGTTAGTIRIDNTGLVALTDLAAANFTLADNTAFQVGATFTGG